MRRDLSSQLITCIQKQEAERSSSIVDLILKNVDFDEEQTKDVYAHYGLALYEAQCLEHGIVNALVILRLPQKEKYTRRDIDEFMDGKFQNTLGILIKHLKTELAPPTDLEFLLTDALKRRNYLAHHYFRERAEQFVTRDGRAKMLLEIQSDQELFEKADNALSNTMKPLRVTHGITDSVFEAEYMRMCKKLGISP